MPTTAETVQLLSPEGTPVVDSGADEYQPYIDELSDATLRDFHREMVVTRAFDIEAANLQRQGQLGLWVPSDDRRHVHLWDGSTRLRDPRDRHRRLERREGLVLHWEDLDPDDGDRCATSAAAAVACIARCFGVHEAIRVADSALDRGLAGPADSGPARRS